MSAVIVSLLAVGVLAVALKRGGRIPLAGARKRLAIGVRAALLLILTAALMGLSCARQEEVPRRVVYLVDRSASVDAAQREWQARRIASLESLRPDKVQRALVAFGAGAPLVVAPGSEPLTDPQALQKLLALAPVDERETNLEAALLSVSGLLPSRGRGGVILLSDGRETAGDVSGTLSTIRRMGMEVFPEALPLSGKVKTVWEDLAVDPLVRQGASVAVRLVVFNGAMRAKQGRVRAFLKGVPIKSESVLVRPGWQVVSLSVPALARGTLALDVRLEMPEEGISEERSAYTEVEGPPQVLVVGAQLSALPAVAAVLKRAGMGVTLARPEELSADALSLIDQDAIVFFNVPKSRLTEDQAAALRTYLERFGGGLVTLGLGGDLAHEVSTVSPLDALLPLQFEPKGLQEVRRRVCIVLLIDRSASMVGPRIAATKRASVELVKQLAPEDLVGILAFDTQPYVVAEVQPAGQVGSWLVEKLVQLRSSGGTDVYPALVAAAKRLELTGATLKHIILLSDGNTPFQAPAYKALVELFKRSGTTVSTIGIGSAFVNTDYLQWLAQSTGGAFYQLRAVEELPQLVARDAQQQLGRLPFTEGFFRPEPVETSDWFADVGDWPPLRGFLTASAKPGARIDLTVRAADEPSPLLARWSLGRGRVAAFASDADRRWSPEWIRWNRFDGVWNQVIRWAMRPQFSEELFAWVDESAAAPQLVIEGALSDPQASLIGAGGAPTLPLSLVQIGAWRWRAPLEQIPGGWYQLALESHLREPHPGAEHSVAHEGPDAEARSLNADEERGPLFAKRWIQIGASATTLETPGQPPREELLRRIAQASGGAFDAPEAAFLPPTTEAQVLVPLAAWWLPLVILILLVDIALRGSSML